LHDAGLAAPGDLEQVRGFAAQNLAADGQEPPLDFVGNGGCAPELLDGLRVGSTGENADHRIALGCVLFGHDTLDRFDLDWDIHGDSFDSS
jgi:hypothetical protein